MERAERRRRLAALAGEENPLKRRLGALALLADRLHEDGIVPIVVGGTALEFYTGGGYATADIDLALPLCPEVDEAFRDLGFAKEGRYWLREDLDLLLEAPAPAGLPGETAPRTTVTVDGLPVTIIGLEDLLLDRLRAWVHWQSSEDERWATRLALLYADTIDWAYLRRRTERETREGEALRALESRAEGEKTRTENDDPR